MCGIFGVTGAGDPASLVLEGLKRLEYRGYDSAGAVLATSSGFLRVRAANGTSSLGQLSEMLKGAPEAPLAALGHTRWATHGSPSQDNAHPHLDCKGRVAVVHNGIVENHASLRSALVASGHVFSSDTDSEVLAHLIEEHLAAGEGLLEAVLRCISQVHGTFALGAIDIEQPERLVAARRVSPLLLGRSDKVSLLASDVTALLGRCNEVFVLEDDQAAELLPGSLRVVSLQGKEATPVSLKVDWDLEAAEKGGYESFMLKEIFEQPHALADTLAGRLGEGEVLLDEELQGLLADGGPREISSVLAMGCGTSRYASMAGALAIERWARLACHVEIASELRYKDLPPRDRVLAVAVSQSGETVDTIGAQRWAAAGGAKTLAVCNVVGSTMAREAPAALFTRAGPEIGVAATKTFVSQVALLDLLALWLARHRGTLPRDEQARLVTAMGELPSLVAKALEHALEVAGLAKVLHGSAPVLFLGRHAGYPVAMEGALKLKELAYIYAEGYAAGEMKHGPIALVEPGAVCIGLATRGPLWQKTLSNLEEARARGARLVLVVEEGDEETASFADEVLWVPPAEDLLAPIVNVVPLQLLAYHLARLAGRNVDRPRNLAKTVTVE
jgi:glucosamine--fructose-6-phosphate aminotransferase (isomerizing)